MKGDSPARSRAAQSRCFCAVRPKLHRGPRGHRAGRPRLGAAGRVGRLGARSVAEARWRVAPLEAVAAIGNLGDDAAADQVASASISAYGGIDILVNNLLLRRLTLNASDQASKGGRTGGAQLWRGQRGPNFTIAGVRRLTDTAVV